MICMVWYGMTFIPHYLLYIRGVCCPELTAHSGFHNSGYNFTLLLCRFYLFSKLHITTCQLSARFLKTTNVSKQPIMCQNNQYCVKTYISLYCEVPLTSTSHWNRQNLSFIANKSNNQGNSYGMHINTS